MQVSSERAVWTVSEESVTKNRTKDGSNPA